MPILSDSIPRKQARSEGKEVPGWLSALGVAPGEFYQDAKAWVFRAMRDPTWGEKTRVFLCLTSHTVFFHTERAVKLERGKVVPMMVKDIAQECDMDRRQVCRGLAALESTGYAARDGEWIIRRALPESLKPVGDAAEERPEIVYPEDLPAEFVRYLKRYRLGLEELPQGSELEEAKQIASDIARGESRLQEILKHKPVTSDVTRVSAENEVPADTHVTKKVTRASAHIRSKDSERKSSITAAAVESAQGQDGQQQQASPIFPKTDAAVRSHDAGISAGFVQRLAHETLDAAKRAGVIANDAMIAQAVEESYQTYTGKRAHGSGLLLHRVPEIICSGVSAKPRMTYEHRNATDATMDLILRNIKTRGRIL